MNGLVEKISRKADSFGAVEISSDFAKKNISRLSVVAAAPFEPTLKEDTLIYVDRETGLYYKLVRSRK